MSLAPMLESRRPSAWRLIGFVALLSAVSWGLGAFSAFPLALSDPKEGQLIVSFKHVAPFEREGKKLSREEIEKLPRHMRPQDAERSRTGRRVETFLSVRLDGRPLIEKVYRPSGFGENGPTFAYEELKVPAGRHVVEATLADAQGKKEEEEEAHQERRRWLVSEEVLIRPRQLLLIDFSPEAGLSVR